MTQQKAIQTAILYATGFRLADNPEAVYDNTDSKFEHLQVQMIKALDRGDYAIDVGGNCANVLGYLVYF